jgi:hypothetical protein
MLLYQVKTFFVAFLVGVFAVVAFAGQSGAQTTFRATLDASQVINGSSEPGFASAIFFLDAAEQNLSYSIQFNGLNLEPVPGNRTGFSDINAIHIHNGFAGSSGPHVLNIFGAPSEDDAEMVTDFFNESITGIYNDADAIDPVSGGLFDQNSPATTKLLSNFVDDLRDGSLYLAAHTAGQGGNIAIRGQLVAVPEPSTALLLMAGGLCCIGRRKRSVK